MKKRHLLITCMVASLLGMSLNAFAGVGNQEERQELSQATDGTHLRSVNGF